MMRVIAGLANRRSAAMFPRPGRRGDLPAVFVRCSNVTEGLESTRPRDMPPPFWHFAVGGQNAFT